MASVKIYTSPACAFCKFAKEYFESKNIEYEEYDVSTDAEKRDELIQKSGGLSVPVIDIDGKIIVGFNKGKINEALGIS